MTQETIKKFIIQTLVTTYGCTLTVNVFCFHLGDANQITRAILSQQQQQVQFNRKQKILFIHYSQSKPCLKNLEKFMSCNLSVMPYIRKNQQIFLNGSKVCMYASHSILCYNDWNNNVSIESVVVTYVKSPQSMK